jgi:structural maintenance of chromosomes protein 6
LAAIQICLGAGARSTHRARKLEQLIRHSDTTSRTAPNCAKIRVTVLNASDDGYQRHIYGDYITVERTITVAGTAGSYASGGYKLYGADGKEKSRSKKDLEDMLDVL